MTTVVAEALHRHHRLGQGNVVCALDGVDLRVGDGERVAILGRSGSGKSTLLNLVGGLDRATSGRVVVDGEDLGRLSERALARYRRTTVGFVFQSFHLQPRFPAWESVALPLVFEGVRRRERRRRAFEMLDRVGLVARREHRPSELSGGEQQRVALARSLVGRPRLLLADEPTGNLDSATSGQIVDLILDLAVTGSTVLVVTHDDTLAARLGTRVVHMADGRVVEPRR